MGIGEQALLKKENESPLLKNKKYTYKVSSSSPNIISFMSIVNMSSEEH